MSDQDFNELEKMLDLEELADKIRLKMQILQIELNGVMAILNKISEDTEEVKNDILDYPLSN